MRTDLRSKQVDCAPGPWFGVSVEALAAGDETMDGSPTTDLWQVGRLDQPHGRFWLDRTVDRNGVVINYVGALVSVAVAP